MSARPWSHRRWVLAAVLALAVLGTSGAAGAQELTVSAAVSLKEAVEDIGRLFVRAHRGAVVRYNFGASGALQKQIEAGAPVDVFISAATRQMDDLAARGLIAAATRRVFARNVLIAVAPVDSRIDLSRPARLAEAQVSRIALGHPRTVPAGQYTEEMLRALGLWDRLRTKLVYGEDVRQVLEYVSRGEVDVGFVYATDAARRTDRVKEVFRPDEATYSPVVYPAAAITASRRPALAAAFVAFLAADESQAILRRLGFQPAPAAR